MKIQQEEVLIKEFTSGNTLIFFSTQLSAISDDIQDELIPSIVWFNNLNQPYKVTPFRGDALWVMNSQNYNQIIDEIEDNYITGHSIVRDYNFIISEDKFESIKLGFIQDINNALTTEENGIQITAPHTDFVFKLTHQVDDFFVNVNLKRSFATLDTLDVYHNLVNTIPNQESQTGVVFGRLMALQNIKDSQGNNIKIPLRNVPIGIFNSSDEYPTTSSLNENGERIFLNSKESSYIEDYFNQESWSSDTQNYLRSTSQFTNVPEQYKYITTTNENGEFIIYDAPLGTQVVVFEVDLFKQGLTKDEIALNFFPFPPSNDSLLDQFPCFSFKQFPINVFPSWGSSQTGYTELNITVNLDLRKWATFYVPPISYDGKKLGSLEMSLLHPSLNIDIRDMSKDGFPISKVPVVEIQNIYDKEEEQTLSWNSEFVQLKKTVKFYEHGFKAFKIKANMYDPYGFKTNSNGVPINYPSQKGVWLAGYQFKMYYNEPSSIFRTTGFQRDWGFQSPGWRGRDHFHLNRNEASEEINSNTGPQNYPPYDRPWNHLYPEPYKIPSKPIDKNFFRETPSSRLPGNHPFFLEQPEYKDGDLIGLTISNSNITTEPAGGFGVQFSSKNNFWFTNRFSKEVAAKFLYKYEAGVSWNETYANGYEPSNSSYPIQPGISSVLNGERFQRVECGYGYWLRPDGWPPVSSEPWGDAIFSRATTPGAGLNSDDGPSVLSVGQNNGIIKVQVQNQFIDVYNIDDLDISLAMDNNATFGEGGLSIYRIIDPSDRIPQTPQVIPTFAIFNFQDFYFQRGNNGTNRIRTAHITANDNLDDNYFSKLVGGSSHAQFGYNLLQFEITNNGNIPVAIPNTSITISPGKSATFTATELQLQGLQLKLPGNSNFDFTTSKYTRANYGMKFKNILCKRWDGSNLPFSQHNVPQERIISNTNVLAETTPPNYYLITRYGNVRTQYNNSDNSCSTNSSDFDTGGLLNPSNWTNKVKMNGALFQVPNTNGGGYIIDMRFWDNPINATCHGEPFGPIQFRIPIEVID